MIRLELQVSEIDFDRLAERFLPELIAHLRATGNPLAGVLGGSKTMALGILRRLPADTKEKLAVQLLTARKQDLTALLENAAAEQGIPMRITGAQIRKV